ncbi:hypothetical protein BCR35DRAFT_302706 [Leucosporidium creatinivorum]|uniref:F-box domain-containing protein n=1 Tax=Leucosporidium creatinivorum TaxID=106004 RepID=A0A1Y2FRY4_9BASI|nr:hypothetical protein BCR35DRAFT_302706 [Leucosporidium creatinivorum]
MAGAVAQLPNEVLTQIFQLATGDDRIHGGKIYAWSSNERAYPLALVCKAWYPPAQFVLFASVSIFNSRDATLFLRTVADRPRLALHTRKLVVTLDEEEEEIEDEQPHELEQRHVVESEQLTRIVEVCDSLERLQSRTIHPRVAWPFLEAIIAKTRILTFIGGPRPINYNHSWHQQTFNKPLELESPYAAGTRPAPLLLFPKLEEARLACEIPSDTLCGFMQATAATMTSFDLYQERLLSVDEFLAGLSHGLKTMRRLKFRVNPSITDLETKFSSDTIPLFDQLFALEPTYEQLESLSVAATDISCEALRILPPCLRHLEISSFSDFSLFTFSDRLLEVMRDSSIRFHLETLTVRDVLDCWGAEGNIKKMTEACKARGIVFTFLPEED